MDKPKRRRGRPKGSKNKKHNLSGASIAKICEYHKFNPVEKLIQIATNTDPQQQWADNYRFQATQKLVDGIHNNKALPGSGTGEVLDGQFELIFLEAPDSPALPGTTPAESSEGTLCADPLQRIGVP